MISLDNRIAGEDVTVVVSSLEESSVVIMGRCMVQSESYWKARWFATEEIKLRYDARVLRFPIISWMSRLSGRRDAAMNLKNDGKR